MERSPRATRTREPARAATYRGTLLGDGRPGPIEQRIGRRLVRLIDPESEEGLDLLEAGRVDLIGPDGDALGRLTTDEAYRLVLERLEARLDRKLGGADVAALRDGMEQVRDWSRRLRRG